MDRSQIYQAIDDPEQWYRQHKVAYCFLELARSEGKQEYQLEGIAFSLYHDENWKLGRVSPAEMDLVTQPYAKSFFQKRLSATSHPETLARYGHLLWQQHQYFPGYQTAVAAYLQTAGHALGKLCSTEKYFSRWNKAICPALILSVATRDQTSFEKAKELVNQMIHQPVPLWMKSTTIADVLKNLKGKAKLFDLENYIIEVQKSEWKRGYSQPKDDHQTAVEADQLYGSKRRAFLWEKMADGIRAHALGRTNDPARIVTMPQLAEAMELYKKAKADDSYQQTANEYQLLKKTRKVNSISVNLIDSETWKLLIEYIEQRVEYFLAMEPDDILISLATDLSLLPWTSGSEEPGIYDQLAEQMTLVNFDINQNPKVLSEAGSRKLSDAWSYKMKYRIFTAQYISGIMQELIKKDQLSIQTLDAFFKKTWICHTTLAASSGNSEDEYELYSGIRPAMAYYLDQASRFLRGEDADFTLCIDSLVLKYEMLIRCLLRHLGVATTVIDSQSGDPRECYLPDLLDKLPENSFDEKDKQLMQHIYTKKGIDLRNNVAHSFLASKSYTVELAEMVVWSIIRLGQYAPSSDKISGQ